jgi:hypothetical protein
MATKKPQMIKPMVPKGKKIAICMPCTSTVLAKTAFSLVHAVHKVDFDYDMLMQISCDIIGGRVRLTRQALESGCTHMLFVDHDMYFPPNAISQLLAEDKDIIGAEYNFRQLPPKSTAFPVDENVDKSEPYRCEVVGTGLMLIKLSVFEKIPEPWFLFGRDKLGNMVNGEDAWFCQQAIKAGFEVWAHPNLGVKHIGDFAY